MADILAGGAPPPAGKSAKWQEYLRIAKPETRSAIIVSYSEAWQDEIFTLIKGGLNVSERYGDHAKWGTSTGEMFDYVPDHRSAPFMGFERALAYLRADVSPEEAARLEAGAPDTRQRWRRWLL